MVRCVWSGLLLVVACAPGPTMPQGGPLRAGVSEVVIDVPVGAPTGGYSRAKPDDDPGSRWANSFPATKGVHTDAQARAIVFATENTRVALIRLDVCLITPSLRARVRKKLDAAQEPAGFVLQATHTHGQVARFFQPVHIGTASGPDFVAFGMDTYDPELEERIASAAAQSALEAFSRLGRVSVGSAAVEAAQLNSDRRCENDPLYGADFRDTKLTVVRVDEVDEGGAPVRPLAALVHFSVHGTVMSGSNPLLTTDVSGAIETAAGDLLGVPVVFLQGAAGDVSPKGGQGFDGTQRLEWLGLTARPLIAQAFDEAKPGPAPAQARLLQVDRGVPLSREGLGYPRGQFPEHGGIGCMVGGRSCAAPVLTPPEEGALLCGPVEPRPRLRTQLTLVQVEDVAFVTLPGEPTTEIGRKAAAALAPLGTKTNLVLGYAQDHYGYLLEQDDFLRGGYEPTVSPWGWRFGGFLVDEVGRLVAERAASQEKPTDPELPDVVARVPDESEASPAVVSEPPDQPRAGLVRFSFTGGDPGLGTPRVAVEREEGGRFVPVMAAPNRAMVNGPEVIRRHAATPSVAAMPTAVVRRHEWTALWETLPATPLGRYRLVATGRAKVQGTVQTYRLESVPFSLTPATSVTQLFVRPLGARRVSLSFRYAPNPQRFERGEPVANFRLRELDGRPDVGQLVREGRVQLEASVGAGPVMRLEAPWDAAVGGYVVTLPGADPGPWELTLEPGALSDGLGNGNGGVLRGRVSL